MSADNFLQVLDTDEEGPERFQVFQVVMRFLSEDDADEYPTRPPTPMASFATEEEAWAYVDEHYADVEELTAEDCLQYDPDTCKGEVEYFSPDGRGNAFPRCQYHIEKRMESYENSMEKYAHSDVPPDWFDPMDAGERWDDDY